MASSISNGLSTQRSPNTSYVHDIPIVPPQLATFKEYKEIVPDISVVSDIVDNGSPAENLRSTSQEVPKHSKYFFQSELTSGALPLNKSSLLRRNSYTDKYVHHTSEQNLGINTCFSKPKPTFDTNKTEEYFLLSKHPSCQCHAVNEIAFERQNECFSSPKSKPIHISSHRTSNEEQIERESKCTLQKAECFLNRKECKYLETFDNSNPCTDCNSTIKNDEHLSCEVMPNKLLACTQNVKDCCCPKKQCLKSNKNYYEHEKHVSFNTELRKTENPEKRQENKISYNNSDTSSKNCKKKNCHCKSKFKKPNLNSSAKITVDSPASDDHASENEKAGVSANELSNIWDYIKRQDEKINSLQEQIKTLTENSSCSHKSYIEEKVDSLNTMDSDVPYILNILEVHGDKIHELQSQISSLSIIDMKSSDVQNNDMLKEVQSKNSANKNTCPENTGQTETGTFISNAVSHEQVQVTKTSASTMTSLTFENNDKLVYHKHFTVVTDFLKHTKEMPASSESKDDEASVKKNHLNKKGLVSNSRKKKSLNSEKRSSNLKAKKQGTSSSSSDIPTSTDVQEIRTHLQCEKDSSPHVLKKNELRPIEEKETTYPANFKNVLKNVNELILDKDQERHKKKSPGQRTALKSKPPHSRQKLRQQHTSPKIVDTPISKTSKNRKHTVPSKSSSSSNTSTESLNQSPEHKQHVFENTESECSEDGDQYEPRQFELNGTELDDDNHKFEESATISRYGLSSPNLSVATQRYLENYGLVRDKNNFEKSARKARTSLSKRYIS